MKKKLTNYSCSQPTLYTVCETAWQQCSEYLPQFTAFKTNYTADYVTTALNQVDTARLMPKARQNTGDRKDARTELIQATKVIMADWQQLKLYIIASFDKPFIAGKLGLAGSEYYDATSADHWNGLKNLVETASDFLTDNTDILVSQGKMPLDFLDTFIADGDTCTKLYDAFLKANVDKQKGTGAKVDANNAVYSLTISMLRDGAHIFRKDQNIKKMFTFSHLVSMIDGEGSASLKGIFTNANGQFIEGVTVISKDSKYEALSNKKGAFKITRILAGSYIFNITCPGYAPVEQLVTFEAGTASKLDLELVNSMKKVA